MSKHLYIVETERKDEDGLWMVDDPEVYREIAEDEAHAIRVAEQWPLEPNQMIFVREIPDWFDWDSEEAWEKNNGPRYENVYERFGGYMKKNTRISYLYRDASNYKVWNEAVINGILTEEDIKAIMGCLIDGENFIPSAVCLPEKRFDRWTEDDHDLFELDKTGFEIVEEEPTVDIRPKELVFRFQWTAEHGWF